MPWNDRTHPVYHVIPREEVWVAKRTLGVRPAPDGNYRKETAFLLNKANHYASRLSSSNLSEMDTFIFHRSTYVPSMTYSLPVTTISVKDLNKIQRRAVSSILNKLGVNKNFPRRVAFGPKDLCGLALLDMSVDQGVRQAKHLLNHLFSADSVCSLMMIELRSLQLEAGCGFHLLENPAERIPYITDSWMTSLRDFLGRHNMSIEVTNTRRVMTCREHDSYLMDDFRQLLIFDDSELYDLNLCRIFLHVTTVSDITDGPGKRITDDAFRAEQLSDRLTTLQWPRQPYLTRSQRNLWKKALEAAYTSSGQTLKQPLGKWTGTPTNTWTSFYEPSRARIVVATLVSPAPDLSIRFQDYGITSRTRHHVTARPLPSVSQYASLLDVDWGTVIPITTQPTDNNRITGAYDDRVPPERIVPTNPTTFMEYVETLPELERRLFHYLKFETDGERTLRDCLRQNKSLKIGTDGSLHQEKETSSFGWVLLGNQQKLVEGAGPVDGVPEYLSSTRAELFGIASPNEFLHHFMEFHDIESTSKVVKAVDNRAAISRVNKTQMIGAKPIIYNDDVDIMTVIANRMKETTLRHRLRWVKAHQDDKRPYDELDVWGRLNCDADQLATNFRLRIDAGEVKVPKEGFFVHQMAACFFIDGRKITSHVLHSVRSHIQGSKHRKYLQDRHNWSNAVWKSIDWRGLKSGYLSLGPLKRIKTSKSIHGWLNTGRQKSKISPDATDSHKCPRCQLPNETQEHILTCPDVRAHKKRYDLVHPMLKKIINNDLCPVQRVFASCIKSWLESPETPSPDVSRVPDSQRELLDKALNEQESIGWHLCMRGYLSRSWGKAIAANVHLEDDNDRGDSWTRKTILQLWEFSREMWEHRNSILHDTELAASRRIRDAQINDEITKLYEAIETYDADDRGYFDLPLVLRLRKLLRSRRCWLLNARTLVNKSALRAMRGQTTLTSYFTFIPARRDVVRRTLGPPILAVRRFVQTSLLGRTPPDPT